MKALGNILFIVVLFVLGYAIYPSLSDHLGWDKGSDSDTAEESTDSSDTGESTEVADTTNTTTPPDRTTPTPPDNRSITTPDGTSLEERFPYPEIKPLAAITLNWTSIPERALPEQVTLKTDLQFQLGNTGSATKAAGTDVYVKGTNNSQQVRVTMTPGSENEALVAIDDTDIKDRVTELYDKGVANIRARVDAQRDAERTRMASAATITEAEIAEVRRPSAAASNDEIDIMKASVASGELQGLSPSDITTYRKLGFEKEGSTVFEVGAAVYNVKTLFGTFQTEAKAYIRDGRVVRWERVDE